MPEEIGTHERELKMSDKEFEALKESIQKEINKSSEIVKRAVYIIMGILFVSFAALQIIAVINSSKGTGGFYWLLAEVIIMPILLYDPQLEEKKRTRYETDKRIIIDSLNKKIKLNKIRLIFAIVLGVLFTVVQVFAWAFVITVINYKG